MFKPKRKRPIVGRSIRRDEDESDTSDGRDVRNNNEIDNNEENPTVDAIQAIKRKRKEKKKKRKATTAAALSFQMDEDDDDDGIGMDLNGDSSKKKSRKKMKKSDQKKKKKKRGGLGFGGGMHMVDMDMEDEEEDGSGEADEGLTVVGTTSGSLYGKGELDKLKSEQKVYITEENEPVSTKDETNGTMGGIKKQHTPNGSVPLPPAPTTTEVPKPPQHKEEDFISLDSSGPGPTSISQPTIVSGDDALKYSGEDDEDEIDRDELGTTVLSGSGNDVSNPAKKQEEVLEGKVDMDVDENDEEEGGRKWEEEIAKRAGVDVKTQSQSQSQELPADRSTEKDHSLSNDHGKQVVSQIKNTIATSLENLKQQDFDLESDLGRRKSEAEIASNEAKTKEEDVRSIGEKFEYYQNLRAEVADWASALRYLSEKIGVIEDALEELYRDIGSKRMDRTMEWQDDNASVLKEYDLLDYVVGRQPISISSSNHSIDNEPSVDEFGRDVRSMASMSSNKRRMERKRSQAESRARFLPAVEEMADLAHMDSDADVGDHEILDREERRCALGDAVEVVLDEMDDNFSSISSLLKLFQDWKDSYADDYKQCYANMALVEFITVFARAESCKHLDLHGFLDRGAMIRLDEFAWFGQCQLSNLLAESEVNSLAQKVYNHASRLTINSATNDSIWSYDPYSKKQSKAMSSLFDSILKLSLSPDEKSKIHDRILDYINHYVQKMAVIVLKKDVPLNTDHEDDGKLADAVSFATIGQLQSLWKLVKNLIIYWYPTFDKSSKVAKFCLIDIMTYRFLPIFSALTFPSNNKIAVRAREIFISIWNLMKDMKWLDRDDLMLQSSPMRAVAVQIGIEK